MASGIEDCSYRSEEESYGDGSDKKSEIDDDDLFHETQDNVIDPRNNGVRVLNIWSHLWHNFFNNATNTAYCLSPLKFVY